MGVSSCISNEKFQKNSQRNNITNIKYNNSIDVKKEKGEDNNKMYSHHTKNINGENKSSSNKKKEDNQKEVSIDILSNKEKKNLNNENNIEIASNSKESKEYKILEERKKYFEKEIEEYKIKYKNHMNKYKEKKEKEIEELNKKYINLLNKSNAKKEKLEKDYAELKQLYINLKNKYKEKEEKENEEKNIILMNKNKEIIEKLGKENEELKYKYSSLEKKYEGIKQKFSLLQNNNEVLESENKELKEKNIQLQKNIEVLQNKNKEIAEKYKLLEKENKKIYEENLLLKKIPILVGLNNIGATCYMNATLQCLSNTDELTNFFLNKFKFDASDNNKIISNAYYNVIKNLWDRDNNNKSFSPNEFKEKLSKENPLFAGIAANDSKDLINFLLERFHNELNKTKKENNYMSNKIDIYDQLYEQKMLNIFTNEFKIKYNSIISNLFYGTLETKSQCRKCNQVKYNFQIFSFVEFPLEKVNLYCFNKGKRNKSMLNNKNPDVDLYECFEYNNNSELMTGDNQMYCNICKCTCDSLYGSYLYSTPNYLIINLNRGRGAVYECNVNFPEQLNLFNYVSFKMGNTVYELYAVICHIGPSSMSGHFIAFCKNGIDKKWYKYNDAFVTLCQSSNEYRSGMPYILFYKVLLNT